MRRVPMSAALLVALVLVGCTSRDDSKRRAEAARGVVTEFVEAGLAGDEARQIELLASVDRVKARGEDWSPMVMPSESLEYVVGAASVEGDRASVLLSLLEGGVTESFDVLLVEEDSGWRILEGETIDRLADRIAGELSRQFEGLLEDLPEEPGAGDESANDESAGDSSEDAPGAQGADTGR